MIPPEQPIVVRPATPEDLPALVALLAVLFSQETEFTPRADRQEAGLRLILDSPHAGTILCAECGARIVGMVSLLFSVSTAEGGRSAWLEDMIVHPSHRARGIGARLLEQAIRTARDAGCLRITLLTDAENENASRFYQRAGFRPSSMVPFRLPL